MEKESFEAQETQVVEPGQVVSGAQPEKPRNKGGRPKGRKNDATLAKEEALAAIAHRMKYDPIESLIQEARTHPDRSVRIELHKWITQYYYSKKPAETGEDASRKVLLVID